MGYGEKKPVFAKNNDLDVGEGYAAVAYLFGSGWAREARGYHDRHRRQRVVRLPDQNLSQSLPPINGKVPVTFFAGDDIEYFLINVVVYAQLTATAFEKWQHSVYEAVMAAYLKLKGEYEAALSEAEIQKGVQIKGRNPDANRKIEKAELKKGCIELLTAQRFDGFGSVVDAVPPNNYPEFKFDVAFKEGAFAQFFEQAFEWENLCLLLAPYMWARKNQWTDMVNQEDVDPLFTYFLTAGFARVVAGVRPGYEKAILYYLKTGVIWDHGEPPVIGDPLYVSVVQSLKEQQGAGNEGRPEGEPLAGEPRPPSSSSRRTPLCRTGPTNCSLPTPHTAHTTCRPRRTVTASITTCSNGPGRSRHLQGVPSAITCPIPATHSPTWPPPAASC